MDPNAASAPGLMSSLEAMIQASVTTILDRRLCPVGDTLDAQIQTDVPEALGRRLGLTLGSVGSVGNRMTLLVEQRLGSAVNLLNYRVNTPVAAALGQRLGPAGGILTAQMTFIAAPSVPPQRAQALGEVNRTEETDGTCLAEEELGDFRLMENGGSIENEQPTQNQGQEDGGPSEKQQPVQKRSPVKQSLDNEPTEKEHPAQKQNATGPEALTASPEMGDDLSNPAAISAKRNEATRKETAEAYDAAYKGAVYPLFADGNPKSKAGPRSVLTAKPNARLESCPAAHTRLQQSARPTKKMKQAKLTI